ncbi:ethanolamine kinase 1 [Lingula anatina]|uniref:ethanolamine kinase n=1 Tax=Lingula anatina TaxID=7574 RepID=A0A1S3J7T7_LINAN|nr:ethanolamine kinase 1 [Lingula anatina]|eukprot:XP_013406296.1 ethanolamine kinase 1 [Lingula anatina]
MSELEAGVLHVDMKIDDKNVSEGALALLQTVKPSWKSEDVKIKVFTDGITNKLVGLYLPENPSDTVLVRIYGQNTELFIDRKKELQNMVLLHSAGCAPEVYCSFNNGLCYAFVPGIVGNRDLVRDEKVRKLIAKEMSRIHSIQNAGSINDKKIKISPEAMVFKKIRSWLELVPDHLDNTEQDERYQREIKKRHELEAELSELQGPLEALNSPVVFCHNDILCANLVYDASQDKVVFIDYEYADYNYQAFDIGDHFCEFAGVDDVDYSLYPDKDLQLKWLRTYLECEKELKNLPASDVTDKDVEILYVQVNKFALLAHFFWGVWAILQARFSNIEFDFVQYAAQRFGEYFNRKHEFLALKLPQ